MLSPKSDRQQAKAWSAPATSRRVLGLLAELDWASAAAADPRVDVARASFVLETSPLPPGLLRPLVRLLRGVFRRAWLPGYLQAPGPLQDMAPDIGPAGLPRPQDLQWDAGRPGAEQKKNRKPLVEQPQPRLQHHSWHTTTAAALRADNEAADRPVVTSTQSLSTRSTAQWRVRPQEVANNAGWRSAAKGPGCLS